MFAVKLHTVLELYRTTFKPWTEIKVEDLDEAIGFLTALSLPATPSTPLTKPQQAYAKALKMLKRCRRLIDIIQRYEKI